jgi:hypothetical protein
VSKRIAPTHNAVDNDLTEGSPGMNKGRTIKVGVALLVLLLASFSTARAHQVWSAHLAHNHSVAAHARTLHELQRAQRLGLVLSQVASFRKQLRVLATHSVPAYSPLWDSVAEHFYSNQAKTYRRLRRAIDRSVALESKQVHAAYLAAHSALVALIAAGRGLLIDVGPAQAALSTHSVTSLTHGTTLASLRGATSSLRSANDTLAAAVAARKLAVNSVLRASRGDLPTELGSADALAASTHAQLDLLSVIVPRDTGLGTQLDSSLTAVHAQTNANTAAVQLVRMQQVAAAVTSAYTRDLPEKVIVVSTESQEATLYQNGKVIYSSPVTTGGPELPTDHGVFHIYAKITPFVFHSPFPPDSPYYYYPSPVTYWMPFDVAQGLHDAPWRSNFGAGSNEEATDLGGGRSILGTHGCVNLPFTAAQFIWDWAPIGTTVAVV